MLEFPSVGATENLLTAAVLAKGETVIENAAREPEITDLADMLNRMGAEIDGAGTSTIEVEGVESLAPVESEIMGDRIETGTLLMACGIAGGEHRARGARLDHVETVVMKLTEMGLQVTPTPDGSVRPRRRAAARDRRRRRCRSPASPPTSCRSAVALLATADGTAIVTENVFDNRLGFVAELNRMGADIRNEGRHAVIRGVPRLSGAPVRALDVRAGAALVLAGLAADGETVVLDPFHVDRGYSDLAGVAAQRSAPTSNASATGAGRVLASPRAHFAHSRALRNAVAMIVRVGL